MIPATAAPEEGRTHDGRTTPKAVRWWRLAAEQGDASAQYNVGISYAHGTGVPQDDAEAVRWFRLSAEQGFAHGQRDLAVMYLNGRGVPQDDVTGHMWLNLAGATGLEEARAMRDRLADRMTPEQRAEAQRRAREWNAVTQRP